MGPELETYTWVDSEERQSAARSRGATSGVYRDDRYDRRSSGSSYRTHLCGVRSAYVIWGPNLRLTHGYTQKTNNQLHGPESIEDGRSVVLVLKKPVVGLVGQAITEQVLEDDHAGETLDGEIAWYCRLADNSSTQIKDRFSPPPHSSLPA